MIYQNLHSWKTYSWVEGNFDYVSSQSITSSMNRGQCFHIKRGSYTGNKCCPNIQSKFVFMHENFKSLIKHYRYSTLAFKPFSLKTLNASCAHCASVLSDWLILMTVQCSGISKLYTYVTVYTSINKTHLLQAFLFTYII